MTVCLPTYPPPQMLANLKDALAVFKFVTCVLVEEVGELPTSCLVADRNQYDGIGLMRHFFLGMGVSWCDFISSFPPFPPNARTQIHRVLQSSGDR